MKKYISFLISVLFCNTLYGQLYQIGNTTITFVDSTRNNRSIPTEIYYPADVAGNNVPVTTINADKFPVLAFGHGFVMTWSAYQNLWDAVVPEGFIMAFPKTETGITPSHADFGKDLAFVIAALAALDSVSASPFYNRIDSMNCIMGHSMGGGAAFLGAPLSTSIKTLVTLAPAETNPSAIQAAASSTIPALVFAGGNDCVTPPPTNQIPMYDSLQSSCKTFVSINGGSHCQMANNNLLCNFGEATCTPPPTITRSEQHTTINRYLLPWLKYQLKSDCVAGSQFDSLITADTSIGYQKTCVLCNTTALNSSEAKINIEIFPNPFHDKLYIQSSPSALSNITLEFYLMDGSKLFSQTLPPSTGNEKRKIDLKDNLPAGIYLLKISVDGSQFVKKVIKK